MKSSSNPKARLAVDIGGTFTDAVVAIGDATTTTKVLTTYDDPAKGFLTGVEKVMGLAGITSDDVELIIHGTTLATNALIERRGAKTAFLTTQGHRDVLGMAYENRFEQYDVNIDRPEPLVPRYLRLPVLERMNHRGDSLIALDETSVKQAIEKLIANDIESVAVGYLHSYANPAHEKQTEEFLYQLAPHISVTLSSAVCPEIREYERFSTVCANAFVRPLMETYLSSLQTSLREKGFDCPFLMMTSGGGLTTLETAAQFPIRLVESGPAGGAILAKAIARECALSEMISFDMGGTTAKLCLIDHFEPMTSRTFEVDRVYRFKKGSGLPVRIPVIEMVEIGAGGGSLASVDRLGRIQTGPKSAGSEPGPAAFGRGGEQPTITDSDVILGRIVPEFFAGGDFALDGDAATHAMMRDIGDVLSMDIDFAAFGVTEVVDENMAAAARAHAVESGKDISARSMVAFGGAAPLHAARLGEKLGIDQIIIPTGAGVGSAIGFLLAPIAYEVVRSRHMLESEIDVEIANSIFDEMYREAFDVVEKATQNANFLALRQVLMRYKGQGHEIAVDVPVGKLTKEFPSLIRNSFNQAYQELYGRTIPGLEVEILTWTLALKDTSSSDAMRVAKLPAPIKASKPSFQQSFFDPNQSARIEVPVYARRDLAPGMVVDGPALIAEDQTTTAVTSRYTAQVNSLGYLILQNKDTFELGAELV